VGCVEPQGTRPIAARADRQNPERHLRAFGMLPIEPDQGIDHRVIGSVAPDGNHCRQSGFACFVEVDGDVLWMLRNGDNQFSQFFPEQRLDLAPQFTSQATAAWGFKMISIGIIFPIQPKTLMNFLYTFYWNLLYVWIILKHRQEQMLIVPRLDESRKRNIPSQRSRIPVQNLS